MESLYERYRGKCDGGKETRDAKVLRKQVVCERCREGHGGRVDSEGCGGGREGDIRKCDVRKRKLRKQVVYERCREGYGWKKGEKKPGEEWS